jgi:multisubunit Na+/H+ antiporter MnhB subunit
MNSTILAGAIIAIVVVALVPTVLIACSDRAPWRRKVPWLLASLAWIPLAAGAGWVVVTRFGGAQGDEAVSAYMIAAQYNMGLIVSGWALWLAFRTAYPRRRAREP